MSTANVLARRRVLFDAVYRRGSRIDFRTKRVRVRQHVPARRVQICQRGSRGARISNGDWMALTGYGALPGPVDICWRGSTRARESERVCIQILKDRERGGERTPQRDMRLNMRRHRSQSFVLEPLVPRHDGAKPLALMHTQKSIGIHAHTDKRRRMHACARACMCSNEHQCASAHSHKEL